MKPQRRVWNLRFIFKWFNTCVKYCWIVVWCGGVSVRCSVVRYGCCVVKLSCGVVAMQGFVVLSAV